MNETASSPTIYLDADACPVKDLVFRAAVRYNLPLMVVANVPIRIPADANQVARTIVVPGSPDAADDWIADHATASDLVLTADIPLAARAIALGAPCIDFRGNHFNPNRIGEALASRDLNAMLRQMGEITGGPSAYSKKDRSNFASALDAAANKLARKGPA
jgi:uncharacterized protein YaiI (UPF0178 family)